MILAYSFTECCFCSTLIMWRWWSAAEFMNLYTYKIIKHIRRSEPGAREDFRTPDIGRSETSRLTCRITLSGWLKFGELVRAFPVLPGAAGQRPRSFLPHVRMLHTHTLIKQWMNTESGFCLPVSGRHVTHCLKLKSGMVTQPRDSMLRRCRPFSSAPPGGGRELAYRVTVSWDSLGSWLICTGNNTLHGGGGRWGNMHYLSWPPGGDSSGCIEVYAPCVKAAFSLPATRGRLLWLYRSLCFMC